MKQITVCENHLCLQFLVDDEGYVSLWHCGVDAVAFPETPPRKNAGYAPVEVQTTGSNTSLSKHIGHLCPTLPQYVSHTDTRTAEGRRLVLTLHTEQVEIRQYYQWYDHAAVVASWATVANRTDKPIGLEYVSSFALCGLGSGGTQPAVDKLEVFLPHNTWCEELNWRGYTLRELGGGTKKANASTAALSVTNNGTWSSKHHLPMGAVCDTETGNTLLWQIEANGSWQWELGDLAGAYYLRLSGPTSWETDWWKELSPGESFDSVKVAVSAVHGDFGKAIEEMTAYRRCVVRPDRLDSAMSVVFNDYMDCLWANPTTETVWPLIEKAAALGAEIYCMDAGWYSNGSWWPLVGEWEVCDERFPGGIKRIFDHIRECGMRAGLWLEPEVMGVDCPLVPQFEGCFFTRHGHPIVSNGRYMLDFRNPRVCDHLNRVVDRLCSLGVSYFKFDYNIDPILGTETNADSCGDGLLQCNRAYLRWVDGLYDRHPDLMIETCASGGMRMDYATLQHFSLQSVSDTTYYHEFAHMGAMAATATLPEQAGIWVVPTVTNTAEENAFAAVNAMLNRMYISGHTGRLDESAFSLLKQAVDVYKSVRKDLVGSRPLLPCGVCHTGDAWAVAGRLCETARRVYFSVAHTEDHPNTITVPLTGLAVDTSTVAIRYPQAVGAVSVADNALMVSLPPKSAVLLSINLL